MQKLIKKFIIIIIIIIIIIKNYYNYKIYVWCKKNSYILNIEKFQGKFDNFLI